MIARVIFLLLIGLTDVAASASDNDIVITQVASFTHPVPKENSRGMAIGFRAYFSRINANGGVFGRKVVLETKEDNFDAAETVRLTQQTIGNTGSLALFGTVGTANLAALVNNGVLVHGDIALVAPVSGLPELLGAENVYPVRASYIDEIHAIAQHSGTIHRKRAAFIHLDTPLAANLRTALAVGLQADGREMIADVPVPPNSDPEKMTSAIRTTIDKAFAASPDMFVVFGPGPIAPKVIEAIREKAGQQPVVYVLSVSNAGDIIKMAGTANANGTIISQALPLPWDAGNRSVRQYMADMKKYAPGVPFSHLSLEGYLGAWLLHEGMKRAGSGLNRKSLLAALNALGKHDIGDFEVDFSPKTKRGSSMVDMTLINRAGHLVH